MPRIRTIKPEFFGHPRYAREEDSVRLCAIALLNLADDEGYFFAEPQAVRSFAWPFDEDSTRARRTLDRLSEIGWIEVCETESHGRLGRVTKFTTHQKVDRPSPSKIKPYWLDESSTNIRRTLDERSLLDQGSGIREQGTGNGAVSHLKNGAAGTAKNQQPPDSPQIPPGPPQAAPPLLSLLATWNQLAQEGLVVPLTPAQQNKPPDRWLKAWRDRWNDPETNELVRYVDRLEAAIRSATFCHGQKWFTIDWLLGLDKQNQEPNLLKLDRLDGQQRQEESRLTADDLYPTIKPKREPQDA